MTRVPRHAFVIYWGTFPIAPPTVCVSSKRNEWVWEATQGAEAKQPCVRPRSFYRSFCIRLYGLFYLQRAKPGTIPFARKSFGVAFHLHVIRTHVLPRSNNVQQRGGVTGQVVSRYIGNVLLKTWSELMDPKTEGHVYFIFYILIDI